ncbi:MAG: hypothetical protein WBX22_28985 [Silvibacterium sp.]|jgi:hypothetical protein
MVTGALAFFLYAAAVSWILMRYKPPALTTSVALLPIWVGTSFALWAVFLT